MGGLSLITPDPGLFLWSLILFLAFFFILRKFAWGPILNALKEREEGIEKSLQEAESARNEMATLKAENENLLKEARQEREKIIKEANQLKEQIVSEAKKSAQDAAAIERDKAKAQIDSMKASALAEIKGTAATIAVEVAEKILRKEFENKPQQEDFAKQLIKELNG